VQTQDRNGDLEYERGHKDARLADIDIGISGSGVEYGYIEPGEEERQTLI
jgi:hypothetical protein